MKEKEQLLNKFKEYAQQHNYILNKDETYLDFLIEGMIKKKKLYGNYTCPCKTGGFVINTCPCNSHIKDIDDNGSCHCKLFFKNKYFMNPEKRERLLELIKEIWNKNPQLRLCQLIQNCYSTNDIYYVTDEYLEQDLIKLYLDK